MSTQQKIYIRNSVIILIIVIAAAIRVLVPSNVVSWANFTPVGAIALFGGAYFSDKWKAYVVPLVALLISDLVINYAHYHKTGLFSGAWIVYISFIGMVFIGTLINKVSTAKVILASVVAVAIHWLITDVTFGSTYYASGLTGYFQSLAAAVPFELKTLYGTLFFNAVLFGGFELAKRKYTVLQPTPKLAV